MLSCVIDGKVGYPNSSDKIKVTFENQYINDSGSYTYDISFPMAIHENQLLFGNVQRFDVKKTVSNFEDCKIYVDNRLIMSGKGTVTSISNETVKLQIIGGKSRVKFNSKFESHYIDEIDYPPVIVTKGIDREGYSQLGMTQVELGDAIQLLMVDFTDWNFVGQPGVAAFNPINDESNDDVLCNALIRMKMRKITVNGQSWPTGKTRLYMYNLAVQPNLMYVVRKVLEYEGYTLSENQFDRDPWNRILVASSFISVRIKDALPHWTVYTFLEEVRKLLNASIVFDEVDKTVRILCANELISNRTVAYECEDEFNNEYDESGLQNLATSNVEYEFDGSVNRNWKDFIPLSVMRQFPIRVYDEMAKAHLDAFANMTGRQRKSSIFRVGNNFYIWAMVSQDEEMEGENMANRFVQLGYFNPLMRDTSSDDSVTIKICPVAIMKRKLYNEKKYLFDRYSLTWIYVPSVTNDKQLSLEDMTQDDDGEYYVSVQDALEGSAQEVERAEDNTVIPVMFQGMNVFNLDAEVPMQYDDRLPDEDTLMRVPITFTDCRMNVAWSGMREFATFSIQAIQSTGTTHSLNAEADWKVDKKHQMTIRFVTDEIPDPSKIYVFRNKRYICQKIEMEISNGKIDEMKVGYFYEIL